MVKINLKRTKTPLKQINAKTKRKFTYFKYGHHLKNFIKLFSL
jgi:hypothetical protein